MGALGSFVVLSGSGATLAIALVGALAGFLVWNRPPARVYLGDAGSYLIGTALAMLFLAASQREAAVVSGALLFVGVPVADMSVAIVRRLRAGTPLLQGDRGHVYDQLVDRGWPANRAVGACVAAQAVLTLAGIGIANLSGGAAVLAAVVIVCCRGDRRDPRVHLAPRLERRGVANLYSVRMPSPGRGLRLGFVEPHLQRFGGIRRMVEFANRLVARGHHVTFYLPDGVDLRCQWMQCDAAVKPMTAGFGDELDVVLFNHEPQWHLLDRFERARRRVFYALHYAHLYGKEGSWESARAPVDLQLANSNWTADQIFAETGHRPTVQLGGVNREMFHPYPGHEAVPAALQRRAATGVEGHRHDPRSG